MVRDDCRDAGQHDRLPSKGAHVGRDPAPPQKDEREQQDVAAAHADIVKKIAAYLETARTPSERWPGSR